MTGKIKFVVVQEAALCYIYPNNPHVAWILALNRNNIETWRNASQLDIQFNKDVRPVKRKDFDDFRLVSKGYEEDKERYDFPVD